MKILSLSLDKTILDKDSIGAQKSIEYAAMVEKYLVIVPADKDMRLSLSPQAEVFGVGGANRLVKLYKLYVLAKILTKKYACDLVTSQDPFELGLIAYLLKRKFNIAWNVQEHGDFFSRPYWRQESLINQLRYRLGIFLIKRADSIRVVSTRIKDYLVKNMGIKSEGIIEVPVLTDIKNCTCLPDGQELKIIHPRRTSLGLENFYSNNKSFTFLNIGRFVPQKNLPLLIESFARVYATKPETRLRIIGRGPLQAGLKELVKNRGLADVVEFLPWTDDAASEYARADAYVLSSDYEGWGRVIVEAATSRLPIVMTDVGCAGELIKNEESGLVVPVRDPDALAGAMLRLVDDRSLAGRLAEEGVNSLKSLADKEKTLALYKESWRLASKRSKVNS